MRIELLSIRKQMSPELKTASAIIQNINVWIATCPLLLGLIRWRHSNQALKAIVLLTLFSFLADAITTYYRNTAVFSLYTPRVYTLLEFSLITIFFAGITSRIWLRRSMYFLIAPFIAVAMFDFYLSGLSKRDDLALGIASLVFISYSAITLYNILKDAEFSNILATPQFWVISGILIYFGGNIFVFATSDYMNMLPSDEGFVLWGLHSFIGLIYYTLLTIGLWKAKESQ